MWAHLVILGLPEYLGLAYLECLLVVIDDRQGGSSGPTCAVPRYKIFKLCISVSYTAVKVFNIRMLRNFT